MPWIENILFLKKIPIIINRNITPWYPDFLFLWMFNRRFNGVILSATNCTLQCVHVNRYVGRTVVISLIKCYLFAVLQMNLFLYISEKWSHNLANKNKNLLCRCRLLGASYYSHSQSRNMTHICSSAKIDMSFQGRLLKKFWWWDWVPSRATSTSGSCMC